MPRPATPLVGRTNELAGLMRVLDDAARADATGMVLSGDAGVGKTRLLAEVTAAADERGFLTLIGHCIDFGDAGLPYLPFSEAFGRLAAEHPEVAEKLQAGCPPIARLLPNQRLIGAAASSADDRIERGALFEAVLGALSSLAAQQPVLVVLEDAHWADQSSRDLIGFLFARIRSERIAIIASYRSDDLHRRHPLRRVVAEWSRLPRVQRMHLPPMTADEVRALIRTLKHHPLTEEQVQRIVSRSEGNAFFAEELIEATDECADCEGVPAELADLLLVRLDRLSDEARHVVQVAAVAGRRVPHSVLAMVADLPDGLLDAVLRDAVDAHILEPYGESGYGFRHALLAEAVYDDLLPGERVRLHSAYVRALQKEGIRGTAAELARHARESHDLTVAFAASVRAGDEAMRVAAPQEAMSHYEAALELLPKAAGDVAVDRVALARSAADAAAAAGHPYRALRLAHETLDELPPDASPLSRAELLHALATAALTVDTDADAFAATSEALRLVPADPPTELRARVASLHARSCVALGRDVDAERWAREAIDTANRVGQPDAAADAQTTLALLKERAGNPDAAARILEATVRDSRASGAIATELRSRYRLANLYYELGQLDRALGEFQTAADRARQAGRPWMAYGVDARLLVVLVHFVRGDWDASLRTASVDGQAPPPLSEAALAAVELAVRAGRGETSALNLVPLLRPWWQRDGMLAILTAGPAVELLAEQGRHDAALAILDEVTSLVGELWQNPRFLAQIRLDALGVGALAGSVATQPAARREQWTARGRALLEGGRDAAEHGMPEGRAMGVEGRAWLARLEAEWARLRWLADVDPPDMAEHVALWRRAVEAFDYGFVYEQARSRARLAAVLRAAGQPAEAGEQAALARQVARQLGAEPLLAELRTLGTSRAPDRGGAAAASGALTDRENDVLALLVEGRTNRQVARQLYISEKTVSVHVSNILAKLGVHSRTEAAAVARRDGLVTS